MPDEELLARKNRAAAALLEIPGVTGVGIGGRERGGRPTGELVLKVFVERKRPADELAAGELLPVEFEGMGIDVGELGASDELPAVPPVPLPPGALFGSRYVSESDIDDERYRPLRGGILIESNVSGTGKGTMGCLLTHEADADKVYALTNYHVMEDKGRTLPVEHESRVGQPSSVDIPAQCWAPVRFGTYAAGTLIGDLDAAVIQLDTGMRWLAEIQDIGRVTGIHVISDDEASHQYQVKKRGARTRLTGGTVEAVHTVLKGITFPDLIIVVPNRPAKFPAGERLFFGDHGDSGSVVVNLAREVVGLLRAIRPGATPDIQKGVAIPIEAVLDLFTSHFGIPVKVATALTDNDVRTVPSALTEGQPSRMPVYAPWLPGVPVPTPESMSYAQERLAGSPAGQRLVELWLGHHQELLRLVNENRRVAVAWHRGGGPALLQLFVRMVSQPGLTMPRTVTGRPLAECVDRLYGAFSEHATEELRRDLRRVREALPDPAGLTYPEIVAALADRPYETH